MQTHPNTLVGFGYRWLPLVCVAFVALGCATETDGDSATGASTDATDTGSEPVVPPQNDPGAFQGADRDLDGATLSPNPNTVIIANPVGCSGPGETFSTAGQRCYRLVEQPALSWSDAAIDCSLWSAGRGHLVAITSAEEDDFITTLISSSVWLGATDAKSEGHWSWLSGEVWFYENFEAGRPDNLEGVEHCLSKQSGAGQWNDSACDTVLPYVCERSLQ